MPNGCYWQVLQVPFADWSGNISKEGRMLRYVADTGQRSACDHDKRQLRRPSIPTPGSSPVLASFMLAHIGNRYLYGPSCKGHLTYYWRCSKAG